MKNSLLAACFLVFGPFISAPLVKAQCAHNPTVTGDTLMCPNSSGTLSTQTYDSYQWYKRLYSDPTLTPISGETAQTLSINSADDVLYYFAVEATLGGCTEMSPEVLVDGLMFLPISVSTTGNFTITGNGTVEVCQGDTAFLNVLMPYDTNVVWNNNGNPIAGETNTTLVVTTSGSYTVSASPSLCPDYTDFMFIDIVVNVVDCDSTDCAHDPTVFGDTMMCPGSTGTLSTQVYDAYQWYKRLYSDTVSSPIVGATSQTLSINADDDVLYYFSVAATENGCTEMSPEVLVDGHAFASITVSTTGDFTIGGSGQVLLCPGDTAFLNLLMPYDTNIVWFNGGTPITGQDDPTLVVTGPGSFTVSGAPHICPAFTQTMGIPIDVEMKDCSAGIHENALNLIAIYPNPATDHVTVDGKTLTIHEFRLINPLGQTVMLQNPQSNTVTIDLAGMAPGTYILQVETAAGSVLRKIVKY